MIEVVNALRLEKMNQSQVDDVGDKPEIQPKFDKEDI